MQDISQVFFFLWWHGNALARTRRL